MKSVTLSVLILAAAPAAGQPDYDFDWVKIGHPGNRAATPEEAPFWYDMKVGAVDHRYRMTRTEVTVSQWFEFVQAYAPYVDPKEKYGSAFTGRWISWQGDGYAIEPGAEQYPSNMSWLMAARYANWLQNGKAPEQAAFESGAYDTSTFWKDENGGRHDQIARDPDATFWIPSLDEWIKGMYYDPDRYGPGEEGYWIMPDGGNEDLISGYPDEGGETNGGIEDLGNFGGMDVGSYPWATSPLGLLDGSGGRGEWTEGLADELSRKRYTGGSPAGELWYYFTDRIDAANTEIPLTSSPGLRLASSVPSPISGMAILLAIPLLGRRR